MTMTQEPIELIAKPKPARRKAGTDPAVLLNRAKNTIEKLEEQNQNSAGILQAMSALWLSPDAHRRRQEAEMALNHFNDALASLRKALAK